MRAKESVTERNRRGEEARKRETRHEFAVFVRDRVSGRVPQIMLHFRCFFDFLTLPPPAAPFAPPLKPEEFVELGFWP